MYNIYVIFNLKTFIRQLQKEKTSQRAQNFGTNNLQNGTQIYPQCHYKHYYHLSDENFLKLLYVHEINFGSGDYNFIWISFFANFAYFQIIQTIISNCLKGIIYVAKLKIE